MSALLMNFFLFCYFIVNISILESRLSELKWQENDQQKDGKLYSTSQVIQIHRATYGPATCFSKKDLIVFPKPNEIKRRTSNLYVGYYKYILPTFVPRVLSGCMSSILLYYFDLCRNVPVILEEDVHNNLDDRFGNTYDLQGH